MSVPWLPREISSRLHGRPHELENVKATYLLSTAFVAGYLGREDGKRPAWFPRVRLAPVLTLTADMQEHLANACRVICMKARQEVTSEPGTKYSVPGGDRPVTSWQAGLLVARVLWRALFAAAAAKAPVTQCAVPVLFMTACNNLIQAARRLLTEVWCEVQVQFTSRVNKYRNMKSRPAWSVLEALQHKVLGERCGFSLSDPATSPATAAGTKPAANLQDYLEEVLALRFTIDWLTLSMQDAQDYLDQQTRRIYKRPPPKQNPNHDFVAQQLAALKEKSVDSFAMMWTDDAEIRGITSLAAKLVDSLEGPSALQFAATFAGQMMLAMWKGVEPLLAHQATIGIARIAESHAAMGTLPPPPLQDMDATLSQTAVFDRIAASYSPASSECKELCQALPQGVQYCILRVQANFRGYLYRSRHFSRARAVAAYCKAVNWPLFELPREGEEDEMESPKEKERKRRRRAKKADPSMLNQEIADFQPNVSKYLGGDARQTQQTLRPEPSAMGSTLGVTARSLQMTGTLGTTGGFSTMGGAEQQRAWPLPTADHRACADLFALYLYNMYRRRELTNTWQTLCGAFERSMDVYAELLNRNPALKPCLESIAAQLKRGSVVGYDKAFIAKQRDEPASAGRTQKVETELFKRKEPRSKADKTQTLRQGDTVLPGIEGGAPPQAPPTPGASPFAGTSPLSWTKNETKKDPTEITGEYLTNYLKEMDGDDSQFKDITSSVVPLSTGTSPPRQPPHEFILKAEMQQPPPPQARGSRPQSEAGGALAHVASMGQLRGRPGDPDEQLPASAGGSRAGSGRTTPKRPKLDVPFCMQRVKPIWLPIKAHRFAAYRAKILHLLPQRVLEQYIDFEKQGQYAACVKMLESATPGSLNVLSPATLVSNKPLLVETVLQLIVGYSGLCLKNRQGSVAVKLMTQVLDSMSLSLRDMHPGHRTVLEAYLFDTALSVCYYMPSDVSLTDRAESFFQQASERYLRLRHVNRYCKCCLRAAAVLHGQGHRSEAEYYTHQALNKLSDAPVSSLLLVCYHNLAVHTFVQHRLPDAVAHVRSYVALLRQLSKLSNSWMQILDNTQWLILKAHELWPQYQVQAGMREPQMDGFPSAWTGKSG